MNSKGMETGTNVRSSKTKINFVKNGMCDRL